MERSDIPLFRKSSWTTVGRTRLDLLEREEKSQSAACTLNTYAVSKDGMGRVSQVAGGTCKIAPPVEYKFRYSTGPEGCILRCALIVKEGLNDGTLCQPGCFFG
jgi:hypothetical protein